MKKLFRKLLVVVLVLTTAIALFACNKDSGNDNNAGNNNGGNGESGGGVKTYTEEENFADFLKGALDAYDTDDEYTYSLTATTVYTSVNDKTTEEYKTVGTEARSGNKFYAIMTSYEKGQDGVFSESDKEISAVKVVDDNGVSRTKEYYFYEDKNDEDAFVEKGSYVAPDAAKEMSEYGPWSVFEKYNLREDMTYAEFCEEAIKVWYEDEEEQNDIITYSLSRNADGSVTFTFNGKFTYQKFFGEEVATVSSDATMTYVVADGRLVRYDTVTTAKNEFTENTDKNYDENEIVSTTYTYNSFNDAEYDAIDVTTDETDNDYVGYVNLYINGYRYIEYMRVPVGEEVTVEDVKAFLSDWDTNCNYNTIIDSDADSKNTLLFLDSLSIYTDPEIEESLESLKITEYEGEYSLFVTLTPPANEAFVITVIPVENGGGALQIRFLHRCENIDGELKFHTNGSAYTVVKVDGKEPSSDGQYTFTGGSVHVFYCE